MAGRPQVGQIALHRLLTTAVSTHAALGSRRCRGCQTGGAKRSARYLRDCECATHVQSPRNARCGESRYSFSRATGGSDAGLGLGAAEHHNASQHAAGSNCQTLAALGAACVDDGTAAASLHADEKAVRARAAYFGSLVGAFHDALLCLLVLACACVRPVGSRGVSPLGPSPSLGTFSGRPPKRCSSGNPLLHQKHPLPSTTYTAGAAS